MREDTILKGVNSKANKRETKTVLKHFSGSVDIREEESEVSHTDAVWVDVINRGQFMRRLAPDDFRLSKIDEQGVVLRKGQHLTVNFRPNIRSRTDTYVLHIVGYYDPTFTTP